MKAKAIIIASTAISTALISYGNNAYLKNILHKYASRDIFPSLFNSAFIGTQPIASITATKRRAKAMPNTGKTSVGVQNNLTGIKAAASSAKTIHPTCPLPDFIAGPANIPATKAGKRPVVNWILASTAEPGADLKSNIQNAADSTIRSAAQTYLCRPERSLYNRGVPRYSGNNMAIYHAPT